MLRRPIARSLERVYPAGSRLYPQIQNGLDELRKARNRVAHHEPAHVADINQLIRRIRRRYALYISRSAADYLDQTSDVKKLLDARS